MEDLHSRHVSGCFDRNMHSCCWFIRSNFSVEAARCLPTCPKHGGWLPDGCVDPGLQEVDGLESPIHPNQSNTLLFTGQTWSTRSAVILICTQMFLSALHAESPRLDRKHCCFSFPTKLCHISQLQKDC